MHAANDNPPNDAVPAGGAADAATTQNPQVRTLLLTDLCDSTLLVERLGDNAAAELFREHDRLVLGLQQRWRGRLIDRSDGLLLLFERAIDGLGFALDYARGLRELGARRDVAKHGVVLQARQGLHVGEVLTWRNSDVAVSIGAKPLEVEGLAKPMAGRLMTLARPGQILLSATAEPLAHRAARELGERGEQLLWKDWGRWRFKGVPQAQQVYEVGEPGIAPLRAPQQNRAKAWRDIPVWRRPAALAAELVLVAGLVGGAWFLTRAQPAIAFGERDWVVVGDLRNLTGDTLLDDSLEQAFRISLEQSRYVNVLSDLKARDTLERMRRKPDTVLDRAIASEIALRDGARAVILPTVAEIGGRVRVSAEVIDPHTQTTVYAASADGSGAGSTLGSIDKVTSELRGKLGEALESIQKNSVSLPNVTTSSLDALKAYALGRRSATAGNSKEALAWYLRAQQLDPQFALAMVATGMTYAASLGDIPSAQRELARAAKLRDRLTPREALQLDATLARFGPPEPAIARWRQFVALYPDQLQAQSTLAQMELWDRNDVDRAARHAAAAAVPQSDRPGIAQYLLGIVNVAQERAPAAIQAFEASRKLGYKGASFSYAYAYAIQRDWGGVQRVLAQRPDTGVRSAEIELPEQLAVFASDRGQWDEALAHAAEAVDAAAQAEPEIVAPAERIRQLGIEALAGRSPPGAIAARIATQLDAIAAHREGLDTRGLGLRPSMVQALGYVAARIDDAALLRRALRESEGAPEIASFPLLGQARDVLRAELARIEGRPGEAMALLRPLVARADAIVPAHAAMLRAARAAGADADVRAQADWLASHRGRAYIERSMADLAHALNIADTNLALLERGELALRQGDRSAAAASAKRFAAAWDPVQLPGPVARRLQALAPPPPG